MHSSRNEHLDLSAFLSEGLSDGFLLLHALPHSLDFRCHLLAPLVCLRLAAQLQQHLLCDLLRAQPCPVFAFSSLNLHPHAIHLTFASALRSVRRSVAVVQMHEETDWYHQTLSLPNVKCICRQAACNGCQFLPLQATVGTLLSTCESRFRDLKFTWSCCCAAAALRSVRTWPSASLLASACSALRLASVSASEAANLPSVSCAKASNNTLAANSMSQAFN